MDDEGALKEVALHLNEQMGRLVSEPSLSSTSLQSNSALASEREKEEE